MRLFAAVRPPEHVLEHLEGALASVRGPVRPGRGPLRWTPPADRHVTVAFYGEVPEGYLADVAAGLDGAARGLAPFAASLVGAGLFDARTLWVGCAGDGWGPLMSAADAVGVDLLGRPADRRSRPHLTVARARPGTVRRPRGRAAARPGARSAAHGRAAGPDEARPRPDAPDAAGLAHALALYRGPRWTVRDVALVSSRLGAGPGGAPQHDVVHVAALGAVAG